MTRSSTARMRCSMADSCGLPEGGAALCWARTGAVNIPETRTTTNLNFISRLLGPLHFLVIRRLQDNREVAAAREKCNWMTGAPFLARLVAPTSGRPPLSELHGWSGTAHPGCLEMTISTTCLARPANTENWLEGRIRQMPSHFFLDHNLKLQMADFQQGM